MLEKKINLLILDDEPRVRASLVDVFASPLFNITSVRTLEEAYKAVGMFPEHWHCWLIDIDLGQGWEKTGIALLKKFPQFPFSVVLSGLKSMTLAADAIASGARITLDKTPASFDRLYNEVCKTAALGFVLNGKNTPDLNVFSLLQESSITTIEQWADKALLSVRGLNRVCETHPPLTPRYAIALYRAIYYSLWHIPGAKPNNAPPELMPDPAQQDLYDSAIEYVNKKLATQLAP